MTDDDMKDRSIDRSKALVCMSTFNIMPSATRMMTILCGVMLSFMLLWNEIRTKYQVPGTRDTGIYIYIMMSMRPTVRQQRRMASSCYWSSSSDYTYKKLRCDPAIQASQLFLNPSILLDRWMDGWIDLNDSGWIWLGCSFKIRRSISKKVSLRTSAGWGYVGIRLPPTIILFDVVCCCCCCGVVNHVVRLLVEIIKLK